jgi:hypothetical protein
LEVLFGGKPKMKPNKMDRKTVVANATICRPVHFIDIFITQAKGNSLI